MRKLATAALSYSAAVFLAEYLLSRGLWLPAGAVCALLALLVRRLRPARLRLFLIVLGLAAGFLWCRAYDAVFYAPAEALDGRTVLLDATVTDWPRETDYGVSVPVRVHTDGRPDIAALLYADADSAGLFPGDRVSVVAACRLAGHTKSGEEITYYTARGLFLTATAYGAMTVESPGRVSQRYWPQMGAKALKETVAAVFPADTAPLMTALLTGDRDGLDDSTNTALRRTGLAHIVAVSGMHVSFLAGLLTLLLGRRHRRSSAALILAVLVFFAALVGNTPSVLRAVFLCACLQLAPLLGRENDTPTTLPVILALLLLQNPHASANVGLQLSFAAVAGIYLFAAPLYDRWTKRLHGRKFPVSAARILLGVLSASLSAVLFTIPLAAYYFGTVSLVAPFANLLTAWAVSLAFTGGLLAAAVGLVFPAVGAVLAFAVSVFLRYLLFVASALSRLPFAALSLGSVYYALWLGFAYAVTGLFLLWRGEKKRPAFAAGACLVTLLAAVFFTNRMVTGSAFVVSVLDVGQGQSIALQSGGYAALIDCGGSAAENAGDVAADYLQNFGRTTLDLLVLTHYHADHANGVAQLMERLKVRAVLLPDVDPGAAGRLAVEALARQEGSELLYVTRDTNVTLGRAMLTLYAPLGGEGENEDGLSVLGTAGDFDVLVTGDMSAEMEARLIARHPLPDIELLVAGHHGSGQSTSAALLAAVTPETAVISVGANPYGLPARETLDRLMEQQIAVYRTDLAGTVTVTVP